MGIQYRKSLIKRARHMRKYPTVEESKLWQKLRHKKMEGLRFRRQHVLVPFIVDFYCAAMRMAIEVDGGSHRGREFLDAQRDAFLQRAYQVRVIRVRSEEIVTDLDGVLERINDLIQRLRVHASGDVMDAVGSCVEASHLGET